MIPFLKKIDNIIVIALLVNLTVITFLQVLFRFVLQIPLDWTEEVSRYTFIFLVYLAASIATRDNSMIRIELIDMILKRFPVFLRMLDVLTNIICAFFLFFVGYLCSYLISNAFFVKQISPALGIPMWILYMLQGVLFFFNGIRYLVFVFYKKESAKESALI